ncbi:MAG: TIGR01777 family oxidoreductase [Flavobacteriaceae bacterium]
MEKVLITGGTGLIGKQLSSLLKDKGYDVRILSRKASSDSPYKTFMWNINEGTIDKNAFENLDYIIHLAGSGIADKKWSEKKKQEIIDSRVLSTNLLHKTVQELRTPLKGFLSASGIGYYGSLTSETIFEETDTAAKDFLGEVCRLWEASVFQFQQNNIRTVALRTGIVLSNDGGALKKMKTPVITPLGNGKQYMPWIHIDDMCLMYVKAIEDSSMRGVYNAVAPSHQTNSSFSKEVSKAFKRPFLPIGAPAFILKAVFGEMSTLILNGSRVSSQKIESSGFQFRFSELKDALEAIQKE